MFLGTVLTQQLHEELHNDGIRVVVSWSSEEDTQVQDAQLIISKEHQGRSICGLVGVVQSTITLSQTSEMLTTQIGDLLVVHGTGGGNKEVATCVGLLDEAIEVAGGDVGSSFSDTEGWLSQLVVSVRSEPDVVQSELEHVLLLVDDSSIDGLSLSFELVLTDRGVVDQTAEQGEGLLNIVFVHSDIDRVSLLADLLLDISSQSLDALLNGSSSVIAISSKSQCLEEVGGTAGFRSFVSGSILPVEAQSDQVAAVDLSTNCDSVIESGDLAFRVSLQSLWDLSSGQFTKLNQSFLRELQLTSSGGDSGALRWLDSLEVTVNSTLNDLPSRETNWPVALL